jgi:uncharacterized protein YukE
VAISNFNRKLEILRFLVFLYGKLIQLSLRLELEGLDAADVRAKEGEALELIDALRAEMSRSWNGSAAAVMRGLREINNTAQRKVRELEETADKVGKVADILNTIDRAIELGSGL